MTKTESATRTDWTPASVAPSGTYGFVRKPGYGKPAVHVVELIDEQWHLTPGQWYAEDIAHLVAGTELAIDYGNGWVLTAEDTAALAGFASALVPDALSLPGVDGIAPSCVKPPPCPALNAAGRQCSEDADHHAAHLIKNHGGHIVSLWPRDDADPCPCCRNAEAAR